MNTYIALLVEMRANEQRSVIAPNGGCLLSELYGLKTKNIMEDLKEEIKFILKCMMVSCSLAKTDNENKCIIDNYTYDLVKLFNKHFVIKN